MVQYWCQSIVFVESGKGTGSKLDREQSDDSQVCTITPGLTSKPFSSLDPNSAVTILICSLAGTYALPFLRYTLRLSTSSGTFSKSTLNHPPSSISCRRNPGVAFNNCCASSRFSSSLAASQSSCKDSTKTCLSLASSL